MVEQESATPSRVVIRGKMGVCRVCMDAKPVYVSVPRKPHPTLGHFQCVECDTMRPHADVEELPEELRESINAPGVADYG